RLDVALGQGFTLVPQESARAWCRSLARRQRHACAQRRPRDQETSPLFGTGPAKPLLALESGDQRGVDHVLALRNASGVMMKSRADVRLQSMLAGDPCQRSSLVVTDGRGPSGHQGNKFVASEPWLAEASKHPVELSCVSYTCARHAPSWSRAYSSKLLGFRPVSPATSGEIWLALPSR